MTRPGINRVEVDMIPLIDIISLLLMFLIVVGDSAASATSVQMKLPRASAAQSEKPAEGQLIIQLDKNADVGHVGVVNNKGYKLESAGSPAAILDAVDSTDFDAVLMDLNYTRDTTSGQEGLDLLTQLRGAGR